MIRFSILIMILLSSCKPFPKMSGTYFTGRQDAIVVDDQFGILETYENGALENLRFKQTRNRIKFKSVSKGRIPILQRHVEKYRFKVLSDLNDEFLLSPSSAKSKSFFENRDSILFRSKFQFRDNTINWTKIIFHSSHCFGLCPDYSVEIEKNGRIRLTNHGGGMGMPVLNDNYTSMLSGSERTALENIITYSQLHTLKWKTRLCCDAPVITIIIYFNQKCIYLESMWPPVVSASLIRFLSRQFYNRSLQKVDTTFSYER
jgi:hypothetical protein